MTAAQCYQQEERVTAALIATGDHLLLAICTDEGLSSR